VDEATIERRIRSQFEERGVAVSDAEFAQLCAYIGLITKWNKTVNLTALGLSPLSGEAIDRLLVEPVLAAQALREESQNQLPSEEANVQRPVLVDVGSGGGSPAIPLRIMRPNFQLTMIESRARKSAFLREAARHLGLAGTQVIAERLEDFVQGHQRHATEPVENRPVPPCGKVAAVSVRAVRANQALWKGIEALLKPNGLVLWFRTADADDQAVPAALKLISSQQLIEGKTSELVVLAKR
jgi:16S rRNA (guanine(527)-N(7))-methyltransferase RsmG